MEEDDSDSTLATLAPRTGSGVMLKAFLAAAAALAVAIGLALPVPHKSGPAPTKSQFVTIELGPG
jgi:hypothetical protein